MKIMISAMLKENELKNALKKQSKNHIFLYDFLLKNQ